MLSALPFTAAAAAMLGNAYHSRRANERALHTAIPLAVAAAGLGCDMHSIAERWGHRRAGADLTPHPWRRLQARVVRTSRHTGVNGQVELPERHSKAVSSLLVPARQHPVEQGA